MLRLLFIDVRHVHSYYTPKLYSRNVRWGPKDGRGQYCVSVVLPEVWGQWMMYDVHWPLGHLCIWWCALGRCVSNGSQWWTPWLDLAIRPAGGQFDSTHFDVIQNGLSDWRGHLCEGYEGASGAFKIDHDMWSISIESTLFHMWTEAMLHFNRKLNTP